MTVSTKELKKKSPKILNTYQNLSGSGVDTKLAIDNLSAVPRLAKKNKNGCKKSINNFEMALLWI